MVGKLPQIGTAGIYHFLQLSVYTLKSKLAVIYLK